MDDQDSLIKEIKKEIKDDIDIEIENLKEQIKNLEDFIDSIGMEATEFWDESNKLSVKNDMDRILAYMYLMMLEADGKIVFSKKKLQEYGEKVKLFPGVEEWFERICEYGNIL